MPETVSPRPRSPSRPPPPAHPLSPLPASGHRFNMDNMWTVGDCQGHSEANHRLHIWTRLHLLSKSQSGACRLLDLFVERRIKMHDPQANVWKGAAAGLAAGLAASWAMTQF